MMDESDRAKEFEELWPPPSPDAMQSRLRAQVKHVTSFSFGELSAGCVGVCAALVFVIILALAMAAAVLGLLVLMQRLWAVLLGS